MKKILVALLFAVTFVAAPVATMAQSLLTDYDYSRITFGNTFTDSKVKPIILNANRAIHAPVDSLTELAAVPYAARYQGMLTNVETGLYFYDATDCGVGATSPTAVAPDDALGCWYLVGGAADIWDALASTTATSGATLVGVFDVGTYFTGTDVEAVLAEIGLTLSETMPVIETPSDGYFPIITALGYVGNSAYQPTDFALASDVIAKFDTTGNTHDIVNVAIPGVMIPATPADGYRVFCTASGGSYDEGKIYEYDAVDGWDTGTNVLAGQTVSTRSGDFVIAGVGLTDSVKLSDYAYVDSLLANTVDITSDTIPADPGMTGYRVFMTDTDTTYDEGKVYTWDDDTNTWDSGVLLAEGQFLTTKGSSPDMIVGGTGPTDYETLSAKLDRDSLACKDLTVAPNADTGAAAADPEWVDAYYLSASPVSGADQVVKSVEIAGDGAVTLTLAAVSTAEAVYRICAILD